MSLTDTQVRALRPESRDRYVGDGNNLYLRIRPSGHKSWVVRRRFGSRTVVTTLGRYPQLSLRGARDKLAALDPKAALQTLTLGDFLRLWFAEDVRGRYRRPHHVQGYLDRLEAAEAVLWATKLRDLEHVLVFQALKRYARSRGPIAANRLTSILKTALRYAVHAGYLSTSPIAALTTGIVGGPDRARDRVLTDDEIRALWNADGPHQALVRFLLITGQRIGETQLATWGNLSGDRWTIPAEHTKNARPHWVPLPDAAQAVLATLPRARQKVFGRTSSTTVQAWMKRWCERENIAPAFTPHDLRRTFTTRLNELGIAPHVVERMLNHQLQGVMAVYNRAEYAVERHEAARRWASALREITEREPDVQGSLRSISADTPTRQTSPTAPSSSVLESTPGRDDGQRSHSDFRPHERAAATGNHEASTARR